MSHPATKRKARGSSLREKATKEQIRQFDQAQLWKNLVDWVHQFGGYVHPSLQLTGEGPSRGIVASTVIDKGDALIWIPPACVISGMHVPSKLNGTPASPWLRCLVALLETKKESSSSSVDHHPLSNTTSTSWKPYIDSLPKRDEYETLFHWSTEEIKEYLGGTTLGKLLLMDRNEKSLQRRYLSGVKPFLEHFGVLQKWKLNSKRKKADTGTTDATTLESLSTSEEYCSFLEASMCLSTRGFHLISEEEEPEERMTVNKTMPPYNGPFLLPVIDLLNHDPLKACTTLQRESTTGNFKMIAERSVFAGEEVVHSYGDSLTSAQVLQTFGFVPLRNTNRVLTAEELPSAATPVSLHKIDHLLRASLIVKSSVFPKELQSKLTLGPKNKIETAMTTATEDDEYWNVEEIEDRRMTETMPEEFLVSSNSDGSEGHLLTEDLITFLAIQFLPEEAFADIFESDSSTTRLNQSILYEDFYLGMLVCESLIKAISIKAEEYISSPNTMESMDDRKPQSIQTHAPTASSTLQMIESIQTTDRRRLSALTSKSNTSALENREIFGRTIRLEELSSLRALTEEVRTFLGAFNQSRVPSSMD